MSETDTFFYSIPTITYSNNNVKNIFTGVRLKNSTLGNPYLFYQYNIEEGERPDHISDRYYQDQYRDWILYLSNDIIDPYYGWYMETNLFNDFIIQKYGSIEKAQLKTMFYINDWANDSTIITASEYEDLANYQLYDPISNNYIWQSNKRFYEPEKRNLNNVVTHYKRREVDWKVKTNKIVRYAITGSSDFIPDEVVNISIDPSYTGRAQVLTSNSTSVTVQHTYNTVTTNSTVVITANSYIYGQESETLCSITSNTVLTENITNTDAIYWTAVTYYDYEYEKNHNNRDIKVLEASAAENLITEVSVQGIENGRL